MTVFSPTDVRSIAVPGGCGEGHTAPADHPPGESMAVDCTACEPLILALGWGWSSDPRQVDLTPDERLAAEAAEREGSVATNLAMRALGREVADRMHGPAPVAYAPQPTLMEQILAMTPEDKAALAAMLTPPAPPAPSVVIDMHGDSLPESTLPTGSAPSPAPPADAPAPPAEIPADAPAEPPAKAAKATPAKAAKTTSAGKA